MSPLRLALIGSLVVVVLTGLARPSQDGSAGSPVLAEPVQLSLGLEHTCSVQAAGDVLCWGENDVGQLGGGAGNTTRRSKPGPVLGLSDAATAIAAGGLHTCALLDDSGAQCWGWNRYGQLGNPTNAGLPLAPNPVPLDVLATPPPNPTRLLGIGAIDAGGVHTCAILSATGGLQCWGWNGYGQIGAGQSCASNRCVTPVDVTGLTSGVTAIGLGENHTCAVTNAGGVKCWGQNDTGQLGSATVTMCGTFPSQLPCSTTPIDVPGVTDAAAVTAGHGHSCALTNAGGVICWGDNSSGQLGDGQACGATCGPVAVSGLSSGALAIEAGDRHTCALVATGVKCWGDNSSGQLGDGQSCGADSCATPVDVSNITIQPDAIGAGGAHACAIVVQRTVLCWGENGRGQLGDATEQDRPGPVTVLGLGELPDSDSDGCTNGQELGPDAALGGQRNPNKYWDVYDTPDATNNRDGAITTGDIFRIVARFGTNGTPGSPLGEPPPTGYHAAFDRTAPAPGDYPWALNGPDGSIAVNDILFGVRQFGHTCAFPTP